MHSREDSKRLLAALKDVWRRLRLPSGTDFIQQGFSLNRNGRQVEQLLQLLQQQQQFVKQHTPNATTKTTAHAPAAKDSSSITVCPFGAAAAAEWNGYGGCRALPHFIAFNDFASAAFQERHPTWQEALGGGGPLQQLLQQQLICTQFFFATNPTAAAAEAAQIQQGGAPRGKEEQQQP